MRWLLLFSLFSQVQSSVMKMISIYGIETESRNFVCSWVHPVEYYIERLKDFGFNGIRYPFAHQYVIENNWDRFDAGMYYANLFNMSVILDFHRVVNTHQTYSPLSDLSLEQFTQTWFNVLDRYQHYPNLLGHNIWNEFMGSYNNVGELRYYTEHVMNEIEKRYGDRFNHYVTGHSWSGNLSGCSMEHLPYKDRIFYSVHKYIFSLPPNTNSDTYDYEWDWDNSFAKLKDIPKEKVIIGEWSWMDNNEKDIKWAKRFIKYLKKNDIRNTSYFTIANTRDTGNTWFDNCLDVKYETILLLHKLWDDEMYLRKSFKSI